MEVADVSKSASKVTHMLGVDRASVKGSLVPLMAKYVPRIWNSTTPRKLDGLVMAKRGRQQLRTVTWGCVGIKFVIVFMLVMASGCVVPEATKTR